MQRIAMVMNLESSIPNLVKQHPLSKVCTFAIGGPAEYYVEIRSIEAMQQALKAAADHNISVFILGKGSNCLFDDRGFKGLVILNKIDFFENNSPGVFRVGAGYSFSLLGVQTARQGWGGLEFASGIPASVGGAIFMNAGANGGETADFLNSIEYVNEKGELLLFKRDQLKFSYRHSPFQTMKGAIVGATFSLPSSEKARTRQLEIIKYRTKTQPYGDHSAGCIFRNPEGHHAGALIDQAGLKGSLVGGAQISPLHGNFIVNHNQATSEDVLVLVHRIKTTIKATKGIDLESEVRVIPYEMEDK